MRFIQLLFSAAGTIGNTLLTGTTWYRDDLWPTAYWRLWSGGIIHVIHRRVLEHIKRLAEAH